MSVQPISGSSAATAANAAQKPQEELTTITTQCNKKHLHDRSCPHTVSTRPAPKEGEPGYLLDRKA